MSFGVRRARTGDSAEIGRVAAAAWRDTYAGLLRPETIESFIERAYSIERVARRIEADTFLVATEAGRIAAFADARDVDDRVDLFAIYALPASRRRGAGSALLAELRMRFPDRPIVADVLGGNRKGEVFYEARGFEPRERLETELFGEPVVERRWWLPRAEPSEPAESAEAAEAR
jgi:GNAT superfamily N-acetyltransferase